MKKFKKIFTTALMLMVALSITAAPVMASSTLPVDSELPVENLDMEIPDVDLSKGILIEEKWGEEEDGTPFLERIYVKPDYNLYHRFRGYEEVEYTGTKWYGATGTAEVTAMFKYSIDEQKVYVESARGRLVNGAGYSQFVDLGISTSGEGTKKAKATYSCKINRHLGGWVTYRANVMCNYDGSRAWI